MRCGVAMCTSSRRIKVRTDGNGAQGKRTRVGRFSERTERARGATRTGTSGYASKRTRLQQFVEWAARVAATAAMSGTGARSPGALGGGGGRVAAGAMVNEWTVQSRARGGDGVASSQRSAEG